MNRRTKAASRISPPLALAIALVATLAALGRPAAALDGQALPLTPAPAPAFFGASVAASGGTLLVGATQAAYVFVRQRQGYEQQAVLTLPPGSGDRFFGNGVSLSGDTAVVCSTGDPSGTLPARAYVFVRRGTTWTPQATLSPRHPANNFFCNASAISGDTVVVGAISTATLIAPGAAYVFVREGTAWHQQALLTDGRNGLGGYGAAVAISGDNVAVSSPSAGFNASGLVYTFHRTGTDWAADEVIKAPNIHHVQVGSVVSFGSSVALSGDTLVAGAPDGLTPGRAFVLVREPVPGTGPRWSLQAELLPPDAPSSTFLAFAFSVAVSGDLVAVSAFAPFPGEAERPGSVYLFQRRGHTWRPLGRLDTLFDVPTSSGTVCALDGTSLVATGDANADPPGAANAWILDAGAD